MAHIAKIASFAVSIKQLEYKAYDSYGVFVVSIFGIQIASALLLKYTDNTRCKVQITM